MNRKTCLGCGGCVRKDRHDLTYCIYDVCQRCLYTKCLVCFKKNNTVMCTHCILLDPRFHAMTQRLDTYTSLFMFEYLKPERHITVNFTSMVSGKDIVRLAAMEL